MAIKKYSLEHSPSQKDKNRYRLNISGSEKDIENLASKLGKISSRPFPAPEGNYNFSLFLYGINDETKQKITDHLEKYLKMSSGEPDKNIKKPAPVEEKFSKLKKDYTFEKFIVGANTRFTYAACKAVAENPGKNYNPLFIYGGVGLGKTHLMQSIGNYARENFPDLVVVYVSTQEFINEIVSAIEEGEIKKRREKYKKIDLLLIDDIQFLQQSESTQEEFFLIFNEMHDVGKQIVITSDKPPKELATLEDRLRSRFEWGLTTDIKSPNFETRKAIFKKKAEEKGLTLEDDVINYVAERLTSNIRELEGILNRISAYRELADDNINLELVRDIIKNILPQERKPSKEEPAEEKYTKKPAADSRNGKSTVPPHVPQAQQFQYPPPPPQSPLRHHANVCSYCRGVLVFVPQYRRWYCSSCGQYQDPVQMPAAVQPLQVPPAPEESGRTCGKCSAPLRYISQYDRYYCQACREYASEDMTPPPPPEEEKPSPVEDKTKEAVLPEVKEAENKEQKKAAKEQEQYPKKDTEKIDIENSIIGEEKKEIRKIKAGYFIPSEGQKDANKLVDKLNKLAMHKKFNFYIKPLFVHYYDPGSDINFDKIAHMADTNNADIALCMEPGEESGIKTDTFRNRLGKSMEKTGVPFEILSRSEVKESDALNLMLDIAICAHKNEGNK